MAKKSTRKKAASTNNNDEPKPGEAFDFDAYAPPQDKDAEQSVIGSILLLPDMLDEVIGIVRPDDFYTQAHSIAFAEMIELHNMNRRVDGTLLLDRIRKTVKDEETISEVKVAVYEAVHEVPTAANAKFYAEIVKEKAIRRSLLHNAIELMRQALFETEETAEKLINNAETAVAEIAEQRESKTASSMNDTMIDVLAALDARMSGESDERIVSTGFDELDHIMAGGLRSGEFIVLAARPTMGKTALSLNIASSVASAQDSGSVLFISLETTRIELAERIVSARAEVSLRNIRNGLLSQDERLRITEASGEIASLPITIDDNYDTRITNIGALGRKLKRQNGLSLIVVDYLQLIEPENPKDPRHEQVGKISRRLKKLAKELSVPILCLAQLKREAETDTGKPRLRHLRESGSIEQDADAVLFIHRPGVYSETKDASETTIYVAKQRNGPAASCKLHFDSGIVLFKSSEQHPSERQESLPYKDTDQFGE